MTTTAAPGAGYKIAAATKPKKGRAGARWTADENIKLLTLFGKGVELNKIVASLERLVGGVLSKLKEFGLLEFRKVGYNMVYYVPAKLYYKVC
jgi:hypothetical protein